MSAGSPACAAISAPSSNAGPLAESHAPWCDEPLAVMRRLLVAEPTLVPRRAYLLFITESLQILRSDVYARPVGCRGWWLRWFGGHGDSFFP